MTEIKATADAHTAAATATWQAGYAAGVENERARIVAWLRNLEDMGIAYADDFAVMIERGKR